MKKYYFKASLARPHHSTQPIAKSVMSVAFVLALASCSTAPQTPDWQMEAKSAMDRAVAAYLQGDDRVETAEVARARQQISGTGRGDLLATAELLKCATRVASLIFEPCAAFETLRQDATDAQRVYADYLRGQHTTASIPLLPPIQRAAASRSAVDASALQGGEDPLSTLVAAGVLLQTGKANPAVVEQAVATASAQAWRRPLLAWLGVQAHSAKIDGRREDETRIRRRLALVLGEVPVVK
jgi:hypothetical protein